MIIKYLPSLIKQDLKFQFRHGFYFVYGIITLIYIIILKLLGPSISNYLTPIIIFSDPTFIGFLFIGAIIFFEREQRITEVLFVTPISKEAYIISKCISLTILSLLVITVITIFTNPLGTNWLFLLFGVSLTSSLFILVGMILSYYFKKITSYIILGGLILGPFSMPIVYHFGLIKSNLFLIIPTTASIKLISGGLGNTLSLPFIIYSFIYLILMNFIVFKLLIKINGVNYEHI